MTYGQSNRAPAENAVARTPAGASGSWRRYQPWRQLDAEKRLELVERALGWPANDVDSFPLAL